MRKLCLTLATAATVLSTGALPSHASIASAGSALRPAVDETAIVEPVRFTCTHFWNGRWHRRENCFWTPGRVHGWWRHHHHHRHHHRHFF